MTGYNQVCIVKLPKAFLLKDLFDFAVANGLRIVWLSLPSQTVEIQGPQEEKGYIVPNIRLKRYDKVEMWVVAGLAFYLGVCVGASFL